MLRLTCLTVLLFARSVGCTAESPAPPTDAAHDAPRIDPHDAGTDLDVPPPDACAPLDGACGLDEEGRPFYGFYDGCNYCTCSTPDGGLACTSAYCTTPNDGPVACLLAYYGLLALVPKPADASFVCSADGRRVYLSTCAP